MDYNSVTLPRGSDRFECENLCHNEGRCVAWTFVNAGIQAPNPRCWLKESIPVAKPDTCCFSGVVRRGIGPEQGVDRLGGDYTSFNLSGEFPAKCQKFCDADAFCVAWTYVKPGIQAPNPRCWLKNKIPPPQKNDCCVSGVK